MVVRVVGRGLLGARSGVLLAALFALACGSTARKHDNWPPESGGGSANTGGAGGADSTPPRGAELKAVPGTIHRLNSTEYRATVGDLLGVPVNAQLPLDGEFQGFDNLAEAQYSREGDFERYLDAAQDVARAVFASVDLKARVVNCVTPDATCVSSIVRDTGLRLFRRPLLEAEIAPYGQVYVDARGRGETHEVALQQVLAALLASVQFLFRMEFPSGTPGTEPISQYELASRLSYMLWSSAPDDALLNAAQDNALSEDSQLNAEVARLLDDPKSQRFVTNFSGQWLGTRRLATHPVAPDLFPEWTPELANSAADEMYRYFDEFLRRDLDFGDFYQSPVHFADPALAKLYGLELASAAERITLAGDRRGFIGLVGTLTLTSFDRRTAIMQRGKYIMERLLCSPLPAPPLDVPKLQDSPQRDPTTREYFESLHEIKECGSCHMLVDSLGLALDKYDAIGRYRANYPDGRPIDDHLLLAANETFPEGLDLPGIAGVAEALSKTPRSKSCLVEMLYIYGLAHALDATDRDNVVSLAARWEDQPLAIKEVVRQLVLSKPFRFRSDGGLP